jgi:signal peptidase I
MARTTRNPFQEFNTPKPKTTIATVSDEEASGAFGFFKDVGVRETIESILVAIMLALIFRTFLAEAFVIPTGSMAPSLKGAHKEITCDESGFVYAVGASEEQRRQGGGGVNRIASTFCPITQHETIIQRTNKEHASFSGDRILVNKFVYDFVEPQRYDVIVFKYPNNGKQNFIKRLIGLPGDNILIENGDIYLMHQQGDGSWRREITRKPPEKLRNTLQVVDDTQHFGKTLKKIGWPQRWQQYRDERKWITQEARGQTIFSTNGQGESGWLRYRHFRPYKSDWAIIDGGALPVPYRNSEKLPPGSLIVDNYAYNDANFSMSGLRQSDGFHWVGDIGVAIDVEIKSNSGQLLLDLVEGGTHFTCEIDVATGQAKFGCDPSQVRFTSSEGPPTGTTRINQPGRYRVLFVNADDKLHLWINGRQVEFAGSEYLRDEIPIPQYSEKDPGDAEPLGIATRDLEVEISRIQVLRDLYYTSVKGDSSQRTASNETGFFPDQLFKVYQDPTSWKSPNAIEIFTAKKGQTSPMFQLARGSTRDKDQFLPMGDNSPQSSDGRIWDGPNYFERDMLIGRAVFVYFPRFINKPIPFFPNFKDMRFIR